jgi:type IV pilus assembly protein PilV
MLAASTRARGFTLLEVLVAILIVAVGLLGVAGLYLTSLRNTSEAALRSEATRLALDLSERLRGNAPNGDASLVASYVSAAAATVRVAPVADCVSAACTRADLAARDMFEWRTALGARLPAGDGTVCREAAADIGTTACTGTAADPLVVKVWWRERDATAGAPAPLVSFVMVP